MPASYWGLLAKVGPYKLTRTDEKHLHERGSGLHYNSAFTRMMPSSLGAETLPLGIQSQEPWIPKINFRMVENPKFQSGAVGRGLVFRPGVTTERDRAIFNTMESMNYADRNISNLNTEQRPIGPAASSNVQSRRPSVSPLNLPYYPVDQSNIDSTANALRDYLTGYQTPSSSTSSRVLTPMSLESGEWEYNPSYNPKRKYSGGNGMEGNKKFKKGFQAKIPKRSGHISTYTRQAEYQPQLEKGIKRKATNIGKKGKRQKRTGNFTPKQLISNTEKNQRLVTMMQRGTNPERSRAARLLGKQIDINF